MTFLVRRLSQTIPLLLLLSLLIFLLIHAAPGGPLALYLSNPNVRPEDIDRLRRELGLDRPLIEQYVAWIWAFLRGDWGYSYADGRPVIDRLVERLPATLELVATSTLLAVVVSMAVGIVVRPPPRGRPRRNRAHDRRHFAPRVLVWTGAAAGPGKRPRLAAVVRTDVVR